MASLSQSRDIQLFCPVRKCYVKATPEEIVRHFWLSKMVGELGYPPSLLVVERKISEISSLQRGKVPNRRVDILCYSNSLEPLLLIECKATRLSPKMLRQVLGYNLYIGAHFVALVDKNQVWLKPISDWAISITRSDPDFDSGKLPMAALFNKNKI